MVVPRGEATTAWFEWGSDTNYGNTTPPVEVGSGTATIRVRASLPELTPGTVYHYRLMAANSSGTVAGFDNPLPTGINVINLHRGGDWSQIRTLPRITNAVAIACGHGHSMVIKDDGKVEVWTSSGVFQNYGQTLIPSDLTNVVAIAGGYSHCLAVKEDGSVVSWGVDSANRTVAIPAKATNIIAVAAGDQHSMALTSEGKVLRWDYRGVLDTAWPIGSLSNVVAITAGSSHGLVLKADGTVVYLGSSVGANTLPAWLTNIVAISSESHHNMALRGDGAVVSWGSNSNTETNVPSGLTGVSAISAGFHRSLVLTNGGKAFEWGLLTYAGTLLDDQHDLVAIASGDHHTIALTPANDFAATVLPAYAFTGTNTQTTIWLYVYDPTGGVPETRLTSLPTNGVVYQYTSGGPGEPITQPGTLLTDSGNRFIYMPNPSAVGAPADSFSYTCRYGEELVTVESQGISVVPTPVIQAINLYSSGNGALSRISFAGISNVSYRLRATEDFKSWSEVGSTQAVTSQTFTVDDPAVTNKAMRFYRLLQGRPL
jgi:alpha-tubulin suppressor-like RCC1 family protein